MTITPITQVLASVHAALAKTNDIDQAIRAAAAVHALPVEAVRELWEGVEAC